MINFYCPLCQTHFAVDGAKLHLVAGGIGVTCPICSCTECLKVSDVIEAKRELERMRMYDESRSRKSLPE